MRTAKWSNNMTYFLILRKEKPEDAKEYWNKFSVFNKNKVSTFKVHKCMRP